MRGIIGWAKRRTGNDLGPVNCLLLLRAEDGLMHLQHLRALLTCFCPNSLKITINRNEKKRNESNMECCVLGKTKKTEWF